MSAVHMPELKFNVCTALSHSYIVNANTQNEFYGGTFLAYRDIHLYDFVSTHINGV